MLLSFSISEEGTEMKVSCGPIEAMAAFMEAIVNYATAHTNNVKARQAFTETLGSALIDYAKVHDWTKDIATDSDVVAINKKLITAMKQVSEDKDDPHDA